MPSMYTRRSARLAQIAKDEIPKTRSTRRVTKPVIVSSDSEDDCKPYYENKHLNTPSKSKSSRANAELEDISPVTPPKQRKSNADGTKDHAISTSPSSMLGKLALTSPEIKYDVNKIPQTQSIANALFKEKLTTNSKSVLSAIDNIITTSKSGIKEKKIDTFSSAKKALHSSVPSVMPGREKEHEELRHFIEGHMNNRTSGSMYISGPPGTGKTASLNLILQETEISANLLKVYVNCTAIKSASIIYSRIIKELGIKCPGKTEKDSLAKLENYFSKNSKMILLVLDEIDQLESKNQSILYTIFEWPSRPEFHIILVGIANALDLTDRILPRLQARCELKPKLMHFAPYSKEQIVQIFTNRLRDAGVLEVFSPVALQILAAKVAAMSGDVRRALDIGRRVVELVDQGREKETLNRTVNNTQNEKEITSDKPKVVDLKQVVSVLNSIYGTAQNLNSEETDDAFPLQQKIIVCSLLLLLKKAKNKDVTIGKLHEVYSRVCSRRNIQSVDQAEFVGLCSLIETRGIVRVTGKKEPRLHKISLQWDENEVSAALRDKQLMSTILQDDFCLGKC